jgi:NDP-sugar pyrophosphorylase family protein
MKFFIFFIFLFSLVACHDVAKKQQLEELSILDKRVDHIQREYENLKKDTVSEIIYTMKELKYRVKFDIEDDTLSMPMAKDLDAYNRIYKKLKLVETYGEKILFGSQKVKNSLANLMNDIKNGDGERDNYDKFLAFEADKVDNLQQILDDMSKLQKENIRAYKQVKDTVEKFAAELAQN